MVIAKIDLKPGTVGKCNLIWLILATVVENVKYFV